MNYGTSLGKEKVSSTATASFQLRGQTGRAKDATGNLFNAFNAIEQELPKQGTNINSLFG
jgi:iron complex outermembrane receptor protein